MFQWFLSGLDFVNVDVRHKIKIFEVIGIKLNVIKNRCRIEYNFVTLWIKHTTTVFLALK